MKTLNIFKKLKNLPEISLRKIVVQDKKDPTSELRAGR